MNEIDLFRIPVALLAGGSGTRLKKLVPNKPKVMVGVAGKPFLEWLLLYLKHVGFSDFIISAGYLSEMIERYFAAGEWKDITSFIIEEKPLGTGGAVALITQKRDLTELIVMNADSIAIMDYRDFLCFKNQKKPDVLIAVRKMYESDRYGSVRFCENNMIESFTEKAKCGNGGFINAGIYYFSRRVLDFLKEHAGIYASLEKDILPLLIKKKAFKCMVFKVEGEFIDMGIPESFKRTEEFIINNIESCI